MASVTERRLNALRRLAERPGTEAEGILAREILDRLKNSEDGETAFRRYLHREISLSDLLRNLKEPPLTPEEKLVVQSREEFAAWLAKQRAEKADTTALTIVVANQSNEIPGLRNCPGQEHHSSLGCGDINIEGLQDAIAPDLDALKRDPE